MENQENLIEKYCIFLGIKRRTFFNWQKSHPLIIKLMQKIFIDAKSVDFFIEKWKEITTEELNADMNSKYVSACAKLIKIKLANFYKFRQNEKRKYLMKLIRLKFQTADEIEIFMDEFKLNDNCIHEYDNEYKIYTTMCKLGNCVNILSFDVDNLKKIKELELFFDMIFNNKINTKKELLKKVVNDFDLEYEVSFEVVESLYLIKNKFNEYISTFEVHNNKYDLLLWNKKRINIKNFTNSEKNILILFFIYLNFKKYKGSKLQNFLVYLFVATRFDKSLGVEKAPGKTLEELFVRTSILDDLLEPENENEEFIKKETDRLLIELKLKMLTNKEIRILISK